MRVRLLFLVALFAVLAACGDSTDPTTSTTAAITTTTVAEVNTTTAGQVTTTTLAETSTTVSTVPLIRVENGEKTEGLDTLSVRVGENVVFDVVADVSDEVHVHGFDLHFDVEPGHTARIEFIPDSTGIFEVELEAAALHIVDIEVTP